MCNRVNTKKSLFTLTHGWDENSIKYDANGNIQALRRDSSVQGTLANGVLIDQLKYTYSASIPDQLYTVYDSSASAKGFIGGATGSHYTYDANSNLTSEPYQGITGPKLFLATGSHAPWIKFFLCASPGFTVDVRELLTF